MRKSIISVLILLVLGLLFCNCRKQRNTTELSPDMNDYDEVFHSINACIGWFENKDFDLLYSVVSHDSAYISVHPSDKVIKGFDEFEKNSEIFRNPYFKYLKHEIKDLNITFSASGDVAWFYCMLDDINSMKGQPANWENTRWTGVLEKRNGKWVIVQQHFSFAQ
jgi:ketosteroid isomerase-like protein